MKARVMQHVSIVSVLFAAGCAAVPARPDLGGLDDVVQRAMATMDVPGLALAVVDREGLVLARGYGVREVGTEARVDADTLFDIGSITKTFTAAAVAHQVQTGKLDWSTRIGEVVPGFGVEDEYITRELTVADVLSHRAGYEDDYFYDLPVELSRAQFYERLAHERLLHPFRTRFEYHNGFYALAGHALEAVTGRSWADQVDAELLLPLGMQRTFTRRERALDDGNRAVPHRLTRDGMKAMPRAAALPVPLPCTGAIRSSARDMAKWCHHQLVVGRTDAAPSLSADTVREMRTTHAPGTFDWFGTWGYGHERAGYGLGWMLLDYRHDADQHVAHGGATTGMQAWMVVSPKHGYAIVLLSNAGWAGDRVHFAIANWIHDRYLGLEPVAWVGEQLASHRASYDEDLARPRPERARSDAPPSLPLARYVGSFRHPTYGALQVSLSGDALHVRLGRFEATAMGWGGDAFYVDWGELGPPNAMLDFVVTDGRAAAVDYDDGLQFHFERRDG